MEFYCTRLKSSIQHFFVFPDTFFAFQSFRNARQSRNTVTVNGRCHLLITALVLSFFYVWGTVYGTVRVLKHLGKYIRVVQAVTEQ